MILFLVFFGLMSVSVVLLLFKNNIVVRVRFVRKYYYSYFFLVLYIVEFLDIYFRSKIF